MPITSQRETAGRAWTPGPWIPNFVTMFIRLPGGKPVAAVYGDDPECKPDERALARTRLIAAAPELFEALDEILNYSGGADNALEDPYVMERARAALSRVEVDHG